MPNYSHMCRMTDETGMLQFSRWSTPDPGSGYTLDDNARALIVALNMEGGRKWARIYTNYLYRAQRKNGRWSNLLLNQKYYHNFDSEDSMGRALLACSLGSICSWPDIRSLCNSMLRRNLPRVLSFTSPRAMAYTVLALSKGKLCTRKRQIMQKLVDNLVALYLTKHDGAWHWFENYLTYCNGILPHALLSAYQAGSGKRALKIGHDSLKFLNEILFARGCLSIIGNQGWLQKGGKAPAYDQQPVDAASIALACFEAYQVLGLNEFRELYKRACQWYSGDNVNGVSLIDPESGGCYDALTPDGVNLNQGAEAVLSLLLSDIPALGLLSVPSENESFSS